MDIYDGFWFGEPGTQLSTTGCYVSVASPSSTPCLSSPSSGYSSADEGRATPVGGWASPSDCLLSSDPYLGDLIMTPTNARRHTDATTTGIPCSWSGANLVLDDFMDTIWDSLTNGVDSSPRPPDTGSVPCPLSTFCIIIIIIVIIIKYRVLGAYVSVSQSVDF